jgi:tetratricopeptide (TPR) repeat protein
MSRHTARPVKKPLTVALNPDEQAGLALVHLEKGRFRDAMDCYKALLKTGQRPEWLAGLASAYAGRAQALAAKDMRREAIELWRSRTEACQTPLWDGPYASWLIAEGRLAEVLGYLSKRRAASSTATEAIPDDGLAALEAQLAPALLAADDAACKQLPAESLLLQHRPLALAALAAYAGLDVAALNAALAGIPFRSPYRDLRSVLKAMVLLETDRDAARAAIDRVPRSSPFEPLAAPLRCVVLPGHERLRRWASLNNSQQLTALDLLGCPRTWAPLLQALADADADLAPAALFDLVHKHARVLPEALATCVWQWLAPWAKRRGCASPAIFGKPSKADQECATALAVEITGDQGHAEEHWLDSVPLLTASKHMDDRQRAALVLRHMASTSDHLSREGNLDQAGAEYLMQSLEFDATEIDVHVRLVQFWRRHGDLKMARERLDAGLGLFPDSVALLTEAVETALAAGAFKKAATAARRLLTLDPLNRKVHTLLGNAHLSHAGKHIAAGKFEPAKKEIEEARSWLGAATDQGRMQLLLAWTEPAGSSERLRLAQLAASSWGAGLAAGWRLVCEAQGLFARVDLTLAAGLLREAGIDVAKALTPADVLGLVQVLEQEAPVARKGVDPLAPWRQALLALAAAPLFDAETTVRICEAWSNHRGHDLLEKFANAARKRWPDSPVFVYHAVAARFGKDGCIESERDFADLEMAGDIARKNKDFRLHMRIEALFEDDDPAPDFDDSDEMDGPPRMDPQVLRAMIEQTIKMDGGKSFMKRVREEFGDARVRQIETESGGDKKAAQRRLVDLVVADIAGSFGQPPPFIPAQIIKPKPKPPVQGQGSLFDE